MFYMYQSDLIQTSAVCFIHYTHCLSQIQPTPFQPYQLQYQSLNHSNDSYLVAQASMLIDDLLPNCIISLFGAVNLLNCVAIVIRRSVITIAMG